MSAPTRGERRRASRIPPFRTDSPAMHRLTTDRRRSASGPSSAKHFATDRISSRSALRPSTSKRAMPRSARRLRYRTIARLWDVSLNTPPPNLGNKFLTGLGHGASLFGDYLSLPDLLWTPLSAICRLQTYGSANCKFSERLFESSGLKRQLDARRRTRASTTSELPALPSLRSRGSPCRPSQGCSPVSRLIFVIEICSGVRSS